MPLLIVNGDITTMKVDAIVNAANSSLLGGGGVDGAIHYAAGPKLLEECRTLNGCDTGDAKITGGYNLPSRYVIHTVGPVWHGGENGEEDLLRSCYRRSLQLAFEKGCESIAFPLISTGVYGYPADQGFKVARDTITGFLQEHDMTVYIVIYAVRSFQLDPSIRKDLSLFIRDKRNLKDAEAASHDTSSGGQSSPAGGLFDRVVSKDRRDHPVVKEKKSLLRSLSAECEKTADECVYEDEAAPVVSEEPAGSLPMSSGPIAGAQMSGGRMGASPMSSVFLRKNAGGDMADLERRISMIDESFSQMLLRKIDELGMTDVECYKKANLDRKHFSKIRSDKDYRPKKQTVLALAVALELPLDEMRELLMKAGYALSDSNVSDIIIEFFVSKGNYNVYDINEALFVFDQPLLGAA